MTGAELATWWAQMERVVEEQAMFPPGPLSVSWDRVARGEVESVRTRGGAVAGVGLLDCELRACWLSLTDDTPRERVDGLTEIRISGSWSSPKVLYQHLDLPWPLVDRHWAIASVNNVALATASGVWERAWRLDPAGLVAARDRMDSERYASALAVPVNEGSWIVSPVEGRTFGIYQVRVDLGGAVPEEAARGYTAATLAEMFEKLERNAADMATRYGPGCAPQPGGDGKAMGCFGP